MSVSCPLCFVLLFITAVGLPTSTPATTPSTTFCMSHKTTDFDLNDTITVDTGGIAGLIIGILVLLVVIPISGVALGICLNSENLLMVLIVL